MYPHLYYPRCPRGTSKIISSRQKGSCRLITPSFCSIKEQAQSDLILPNPLPLSQLPTLTQEISGFFIIETHVLETTGAFRSERDIEELWESTVQRLTEGVAEALQRETDPESFLRAKEHLIGFIVALEV